MKEKMSRAKAGSYRLQTGKKATGRFVDVLVGNRTIRLPSKAGGKAVNEPKVESEPGRKS